MERRLLGGDVRVDAEDRHLEARARSAIAWPILPRPTMPSVRPRSSMPVNCGPLPLAAPHRRVGRGDPAGRARSISASVCSAAAMVLPVGALTTVMPARVAASRSTLSTPTPARPMTIEARCPPRSARRRPDLAADDEGVVSPMTAASSSRARPARSSTSWCGARGGRRPHRRSARRRGSSCGRRVRRSRR